MTFHRFNNYCFLRMWAQLSISLSRFFERLAILLIFAARKIESDRGMTFATLDCPHQAAVQVSALTLLPI